jgi:hypothetical protein
VNEMVELSVSWRFARLRRSVTELPR